MQRRKIAKKLVTFLTIAALLSENALYIQAATFPSEYTQAEETAENHEHTTKDEAETQTEAKSSENKVETQTEAKSTEPEVETQTETKSTEPEAETQTEAKSTEPEAETQAETKSTEPEAETQTKTNSEAESTTEIETPSEAETQTESRTPPESETAIKEETETETEAETQTESKTSPEPETAAKEDTEIETETTPQEDTAPEPELETLTEEDETESETETEDSYELSSDNETDYEFGQDICLPELPVDRLGGTDVFAGLHSITTQDLTNDELPSKYDAREYGYISSIKSQGSYGTCWAHAIVGIIESSLLMQGNKEYDLSESHLSYFAYNTGNDVLGNADQDEIILNDSDSNAYLGWGGNMPRTAMKLQNWHGVALESDYPYEKVAEGQDRKNAQEHAIEVPNIYFIPTKAADEDSILAVKYLVKEYGSVMWDYHSSISSSIYNEKTYAHYCNEPLKITHAIDIIGWDDFFPKENFAPSNQPPKDGAWIVKNSWGTKFGDKGYFYISYWDMTLGSGNNACVVAATDRNNYDNNYFYSNTIAWQFAHGTKAAQVYEAKSGAVTEILKAVSIYEYNDNLHYSIQIYKNPETNSAGIITNPESGTAIYAQPVEGTLGYAGLHTITVPDVTLSYGDTFSIVFTFDKNCLLFADGSTKPEDTNSEKYVVKNVSEPGQSFIYTYQNTWNDLDINGQSLRINALTNNVKGDDSTISIGVKTVSPKHFNDAQTNYLVWSKCANASGYEIYKSTSENGDYEKIGSVEANARKYTDTIAAADLGTDYYYKIHAAGTDIYSNPYCVPCKMPRAEISSLRNVGNTVELSWNYIEGCAGCIVYRKGETEENYTQIAKIEDTAVTNYTDDISELALGKYEYVIQYYSPAGVKSGLSKPAASCGIKITRLNYQKITYDWKPVEGAVKYYFYFTNGKWWIYTSEKNQFTISINNIYINKSLGEEFPIYICALDADEKVIYTSDKIYYTAVPDAVTSVTAFYEQGKAALHWSGGEGAEKIHIYRSRTENSFPEEAYAQLDAAQTSYTDGQITEAGTYYYKIVPAVTFNGNIAYGEAAYAEITKEATDILAAPVFSPKDDFIEKGTPVTITAMEGASIYYTLDGTPPSTGSTKYTAPIEITAAATIKAVAVKNGYLNSNIVSKTYDIINNEILLERSVMHMLVGETKKLSIRQYPYTKTVQDIDWHSADTNVAAVDKEGNITAVAMGETTITAAVTDYKGRPVTAECIVKVTNTATEYTVTFLGFKNNVVEVQTVRDGEDAVLPASFTVPAGYTFLQWNGNYTNIQKDETVKAEFGLVAYSITYILHGGRNNPANPSTYTIESPAIVLRDALPKKGFTFLGFYKTPDFRGSPVTVIKSGSHGNLTLYAKWKDERGLWMYDIAPQTYTGKAIKPAGFHIYYGAQKLTAGKDYTISYKNNINANNASNLKTAPLIIVKGKGNYSGTLTKPFVIRPKDITDNDILLDDFAVAYKNSPQKPVPAIKWGSKKLSSQKDFTVTPADALKEPGSYTLTITGTGNFTNTKSVTFTIASKEQTPMSKVKIAKKIPDVAYSGKAVAPSPDMVQLKCGKTTLTPNTDYTIACDMECREIGSYSIKIIGKGAYVGTIRTKLNIVGASIKKAKITPPENITYNGQYQRQSLTIKAPSGELLREGTDYTLSFKNTDKAGTASVIITGTGRYTGSTTKKFKVLPYSIQSDSDHAIHASFANGRTSQPYQKGGARPKIQLLYGSRLLHEGTDYTLKYKNNTLVEPKSGKAPTVIITGKGNLKGKTELPFTITKRAIREVQIYCADKEENAAPNKYRSVPVLTDNGKKLTAGKDYSRTVRYYDADFNELTKDSCPAAGAVITAVVQGIGNYKGSIYTTYRIIAKGKNISKAKVTFKAKYYYTGEAVTVAKKDMEVKIGSTVLADTDYEIIETSYTNNSKKGTAKVTIQGKGSYGGTKEISFQINAQKMKWWRK